MNNIYSSIVNFYNTAHDQFNYRQIKKLIDRNLQAGQHKFYLSADNFNYNYLSSKQRKDYYLKIVDLMPLEAEFILALDFDSFNDYQDLISELESYENDFELLIKYNELGTKTPVQKYKEYLSLLKLLDAKNLRSFYLNIDSENLSTYNRQQFLKEISVLNDLKGIIISSSYIHDLDIAEILSFKDDLNSKFKLIGKADDFYYLNLENGLQTVSRYFNLLPDLFKKIKNEYKNNNLTKAKEYQLKLNDFIIFANRLGEAESFYYLLSKILGFDTFHLKGLKKAEKQSLWAEFEKINK